jgi:cephalosporin-C deacetylase
MPILDMPLARLKKYKGMNPRPKDFDAFWSRALKQMRSIDPKVNITPNPSVRVSYAECFDLNWTGLGGANIHAKLLRPKDSSQPRPAVLAFHGYSMSSGDWSAKLAYAAEGFTVATLDCRGQGGSSEDRGGVRGTTLRGHIIRGLDGNPDDLLFRQIFLDAAQMAEIIMDLPGVDPNRVGAMGSSQGGGLTLACAALEPRIKRIAPCHPFLSDYQRVWDMDLDKDAYDELRYYFRSFDPLHKREREIFTQLGYIDVHHLASRIKAETLMAITLQDSICPPSTQFAAFNKIKAKKQMALYYDYAHEHLLDWDDMAFKFMMGL